METFSALLALVRWITGWFPSQKPGTRNFDVFFDLRMNKWLNKQSRHRWLETPMRSLRRLCSVYQPAIHSHVVIMNRTYIFGCYQQFHHRHIILCHIHVLVYHTMGHMRPPNLFLFSWVHQCPVQCTFQKNILDMLKTNKSSLSLLWLGNAWLYSYHYFFYGARAMTQSPSDIKSSIVYMGK